MARHDHSANAEAQEVHTYVPLINTSRTNRVILLDGARGSGKSALLVTLIDAYGRAITGRDIPEGYDAWIRQEDRIVPVGLIDLHPLPGSPHLMLYLLANLERVIKAMEIRRGAVPTGTAAWHPTQQGELPSRTRWREFARAASLGWDSRHSERKSPLDPDAFTVEQEEEEFLRLDVLTTFRQFVDTLVSDYQKMFHREKGPTPFFLLAIDDADMNPDLSGPLLDLLRTLWHPQLAFLLTGETRMFLEPTLEPKGPAEEFMRRLVLSIPDAIERVDERRRRDLRSDVYEKIIPQEHRCELPPISTEQRLSTGPQIGRSLFQHLSITRPQGPTRSGLKNLEDLFMANPQTIEALPDRLRHLYELFAFLKDTTTTSKTSDNSRSAASTIAGLWKWVTRKQSKLPISQSAIRLDKDGILRITADSELIPAWQAVQQVELSNGLSISLGYTERFQLPIAIQSSETDAAQSAIAVLILSTDYASEAADAFHEGRSPVPSGLKSVLFAYTSWPVRSQGTYIHFPWPVPDWHSFIDHVRMREEWKASIRTSGASGTSIVEHTAKAFLTSVLRVGLDGETTKLNLSDSSTWSDLATAIVNATKGGTSSPRRRALIDWCLGRAGLMAAPESGLPVHAANEFLKALRSAFGVDWKAVRGRLRLSRKGRIIKPSREDQTDQGYLSFTPGDDDILREIDLSFQAYRFALIAYTNPEDIEREVSNFFNSDLRSIHARWMENIGLSRSEGLSQYSSEARRELLLQAPLRSINALRTSAQRHNRVSGSSEKRIEELWMGATEAAEEPGLNDVVQAYRSGLKIREDYLRLTHQHIQQAPTQDTQTLRLHKQEEMEANLWTVKGSTNPIIQSKEDDGTEKAMEMVFRIAYDYAADKNGLGTDHAPPSIHWWPGVEVRLAGKRSLNPWPVPAWVTLREWEELESKWNEVALGVGSVLSRSDTEGDPRAADALARWFITACESLCTWGNISPHISIDDIEPSFWRKLISSGERDVKHQTRLKLLREWSNQLILFATPESGLSEAAAQAIISRAIESLGLISNWERPRDEYFGIYETKGYDGLIEEIESDLDQNLSPPRSAEAYVQRQRLQVLHNFYSSVTTLRKQRLLDAGFDSNEANNFLGEVDNRLLNHPWVKRIGHWSKLPKG